MLLRAASAAHTVNLCGVLVPPSPSATPPVGAVYTPVGIARFLVDRLREHAGEAPGTWLDPACGDGALLEAIVEHLAHGTEAPHLGELVAERVFGIDIDPLACGRARSALVRAVERHGGKPPADGYADNIACRDFLLDPLPHGWPPPTRIVANPPYVSATKLTVELKRQLGRRFGVAWGRLDLYGLFLEQALGTLPSRGSLCFITPDKWLTSDSSGPLRAYVTSTGTVCSIARFDRHDLFPGVATVPCVTVIAKGMPRRDEVPVEWHDLDQAGTPVPTGLVETVRLERSGRPWHAHPETPDGALTAPLHQLVSRISVGVATGLNRCFVLDQGDALDAGIEPELLRPAIRGRDILDDHLGTSGKVLLVPYLFDAQGGAARTVDLREYPHAARYLSRFRDELERRHCVRVWGKKWFELHDPVLFDLASRPKIVLPDVAFKPRFALEDGTRVPLHSAYYLLLRTDSPLGPADLLRALRSDATEAWLRRRAPTAKSGYRRFRAQALRDLPIPVPHLPAGQQGRLLDAA